MPPNHGASTSLSNPADYEYIFANNTVSDRSFIYDKSAEKYFEYEKLNVTNVNGADYDYEFAYDNSINNQSQRVQWNNADNGPLVMTLLLTKSNPTPANNISITPFFGYDDSNVNSLKITSIILNSVDNGVSKSEEVLKNPVTIGPTAVPVSASDTSDYFFKKGIIKFPERNLKEVTIRFEQSSSDPITIKHVYWSVNSIRATYEFTANQAEAFGTSDLPLPQNIWSVNTRFNPNLMYSKAEISNITGVEGSVTNLISTLSNPTLVQRSTSSTKVVQISGEQEVSVDYYVMKVYDKKKRAYVYFDELAGLNGDEFANELKATPNTFAATPFKNWWPASQKIIGYESFTDTSDNQPKRFYTPLDPNSDVYKNLALPFATTPGYVPATPNNGLPYGALEWWEYKNRMTGVRKVDTYIGTATPAYFLGDYRNVESEIVSEKRQTRTKPKARYSIQLNKNEEVLKHGSMVNNQALNVRRWSIGLRDVSVSSEIYQNMAEIISKPFNFPYPIEYLMLYSDYSIPISSEISDFQQDSPIIEYYISITDGADWLPISPVEDPFNRNIPEIYAFNQKISQDLRIPGISYVDSNSDINSIRVRIKLRKPNMVNGTPLINYYQIAAKVKRA